MSYPKSKAGRASNAAQQRSYRARKPHVVKATLSKYLKTPKGKLYSWSHTASKRARLFNAKRWDGRKRPKCGGNITAKELRDLWASQDGKCALTGREMIIGTGKVQLNSPSLDRKDQQRGYDLSNIRLITFQANSARSIGSDQQFVAFCRDVLSREVL